MLCSGEGDVGGDMEGRLGSECGSSEVISIMLSDEEELLRSSASSPEDRISMSSSLDMQGLSL